MGRVAFYGAGGERGLSVSKPWGDMAPYDVGVEHNGRFLRVQVKSTVHRVHREETSYKCKVPYDGGRRFTGQEIDFVAAYIIPEDMWYILPARVTARLKGNIWLRPRSKGYKYEPYAEAWHLLRGEDTAARLASPSISSATPDPASDSAQPQTGISAAPGSDVTSRNPALPRPFDPDGVVVKRMQDCFERLLSRGPFKR